MPSDPSPAEILRLLARQAELSEQFVAALDGGDRLAPDVLALERELEALDEQLGLPAQQLHELAAWAERQQDWGMARANGELAALNAEHVEREVVLRKALSGLMAAVAPILQRTYPKSAWANAWEIAEAARDGREPRGLISPAG